MPKSRGPQSITPKRKIASSLEDKDIVCCLMTLHPSKDIQGHVRFYVLYLQITRSDIRPHDKLAVSPAIAEGPTTFPSGLWGHVCWE